MSQPRCSLSLTYFLPRTCCRLTNFVFCLHVLAVFPAWGQNTNSIMTETGLLFSSMFPGNLTVPDTKLVPTKCLWDKFGFGIQSSSWDVIPFGGKPSQMLSFMQSSSGCLFLQEFFPSLLSQNWYPVYSFIYSGMSLVLRLALLPCKEHPKARNSSGSTHGIQLLAECPFHVNLCAYLLQCKREASGSLSTLGEVRASWRRYCHLDTGEK